MKQETPGREARKSPSSERGEVNSRTRPPAAPPAPLYATDDALADALLAAGDASGDRLWRMPLPEEYADGLVSPVADLANVPHEPEHRAGSIDAALFLREFTGGLPWAHLDIGGPARAGADDGENTRGATGFGARCLLRWLTGLGAG